MAEARQWRGKTGGGKFGQRFLLSFLKHFRVTLLYPVLWFVTPFTLLFARKANRALYLYFHDILGYNPRQTFRSVARTLYTFSKMVVDKFAIWAGASDQFNIHVENPEPFEKLLGQEKGFILAGSHIGNFELLGYYLKQDKKPINVIIYGGESETLVQPRNSAFSSMNIKTVPVLPDLSHLFTIKNALENGEIVAILCDRIFGSSKKKSIDFLGHPADFPIGPFRIAAQLDVPVLSAFLMKEKRRDYTGFIVPLSTETANDSTTSKIDTLITQYVKTLETTLKKYPHQWFNLYDFWNLEQKSE